MFTYVALLFKILYGSELTGHMSGFVCQLLLTLLVSHFMLRLLIQYIHLQVSKICSHIYNNISKKIYARGRTMKTKLFYPSIHASTTIYVVGVSTVYGVAILVMLFQNVYLHLLLQF